ncbi:MAG TPA: NEW3 domain-containing protein [Candidatus Aminicenantes bacterium]|nr:NEW3 domain-containing protein [Candidatus Aminicenantes bacterium]HRY63959.1 NEW3 domain-containing protein [Candidatus Aminicenantes bacterium]HRZ70872.1 NEW3 domain-containing protein [Candidatus Aminicenantes bacterium]
MKLIKAIAIAAATLVLAAALAPQTQESQSMKLLELKSAQLAYALSEADYLRYVELKKEGLASEADYKQRETAYLQAKVKFQQALINFMGSEARISVASAVKYQDRSGKKFVRVGLRYTSKELKELANLKINAEDIFPLDFMKEIKDVYVSLLSEGKIISDPYERLVPALPIESGREATFQLLKDVESLDVRVSYSGKDETTSVFLQKGVSANMVTVNSAQFSQEADLESTATYDLSLEKFSGEANVFKLEAVNLPPQITSEFSDPATSARLSQIKFSEGVTSLKLQLKLFLPKNPDERVVLDKPLEFFALALDNEQTEKLRALETAGAATGIDAAAIDGLKAGYVKLELIPRGVPKVEVQAVNLYHEIKVGDTIGMDVTIRNTGTRRLNNVRVFCDLPLNWRVEIAPDLIGTLEQNKDEVVRIKFLPPDGVSVGDYEPKIRTDALADNRRVESEDKIVRIHITSRANVLGIGALVLLLVGLLVGIVVFGIKLTRR